MVELEVDFHHSTKNPGDSPGYLLLNTRPERVGYSVSCGTCQSQRQYWLIWNSSHDKKFSGSGKFGVVIDTYSKPLYLWITSLVMQVFSGRVWRGSEPNSTRTNCFTYPIPNQYLIFHTRSTPTKLLPAYMLGLSAQIFSKHSDYESAHMIIEDWPRHCQIRMLHNQ